MRTKPSLTQVMRRCALVTMMAFVVCLTTSASRPNSAVSSRALRFARLRPSTISAAKKVANAVVKAPAQAVTSARERLTPA